MTSSKNPTEGQSFPLVTIFLVAYNQEETVGAAVESVLAQTYSPLEIILSDDCSADRTYEVMAEIAAGYTGPHKVRLNRNERNLGIVGHVNRMFELGSGELFVAAAGDDVSFPDRVEALVELWLSLDKKPDGLCSGFIAVKGTNQRGILAPKSLDIERHCRFGTSRFLGATAAWSRRIFERWGPLPEEGLVEDQVLALRALLEGGVACLQRPLVWSRRDREVSSWRARELWRIQRIGKFLAVYVKDVQRWGSNNRARADNCEHLQSVLRDSRRIIDRDIGLLAGGRVAVAAYAVLHGMGKTFQKGGHRALLLRAFILLKQCFFGGADDVLLDVKDHRGLRQCARPLGHSRESDGVMGKIAAKKSRTAAVFRAVGVSYVTRLLTIVLGIVVTPIVLGYVGRDLYGFWAIVGSVIGYVGMVDFGITGSVATLIAREQRSAESINRIGTNAIVALSFAGLMVVVVSSAAAFLVPLILRVPAPDVPLVSKLILLAGIGLAISFPVRALKAVLRGTQRIATVKILDFGLSLFRTTGIIGLLYFGHGIMALPWSMIATSFVGLMLFFLITGRILPDFSISFSLIARSELVTIFNISAWWFLGSMGALFIYQTDNIVIGRYLGAAAVTSYALTFRAPDMLRKQLYQLNLAIAPGIGDMVGRKEQESLQALFKMSIRIVLFLGISAAFLIMKLNRGFVTLWVGPENYCGDTVTLIFSGTILYLLVFHVSSIILTNHLDVKVVAVTRFIEGLMNIFLSLLLVQRYGVLGVALATLVAGLCVSGWFLPTRAVRLLEMDVYRFFSDVIGKAATFVGFSFVGYLAIPGYGAVAWGGLVWRGLLFACWLLGIGWWIILPRGEIRHRLRVFQG